MTGTVEFFLGTKQGRLQHQVAGFASRMSIREVSAAEHRQVVAAASQNISCTMANYLFF